MEDAARSRSRAGALAWLVEYCGTSSTTGERRHLTFVDASELDYWGGERPEGVNVTGLIPAPDGAKIENVLAWLVQHRPVRGKSRYLTFTSPTDPDFWNHGAVPGHAMITPLMAQDERRRAGDDGNQSERDLGIQNRERDAIAREAADKAVNLFFENTSGHSLKTRVRETVVDALDRYAHINSVVPKGFKFVPLDANEAMIRAANEYAGFLTEATVKAIIEAAVLAAPELTPPQGRRFINDERAIAYQRAAKEVLRFASVRDNSGDSASFAQVANAILALHEGDIQLDANSGG